MVIVGKTELLVIYDTEGTKVFSIVTLFRRNFVFVSILYCVYHIILILEDYYIFIALFARIENYNAIYFHLIKLVSINI